MSDDSSGSVTISLGGTIMAVVAAAMSWVVNKSIGWAVVHFFCGVFYVLYASCAHTEEINEAIISATEDGDK
jgi:hypothetical protein